MVLSFSYWVSFSSDTILSDKNGLMVLQNILFSVKFFCQEYYNLTIYVRFFWQKKLFNCNQFLSFKNVFPSIDLSIISLERVLSIKVFSLHIFACKLQVAWISVHISRKNENSSSFSSRLCSKCQGDHRGWKGWKNWKIGPF